MTDKELVTALRNIESRSKGELLDEAARRIEYLSAALECATAKANDMVAILDQLSSTDLADEYEDLVGQLYEAKLGKRKILMATAAVTIIKLSLRKQHWARAWQREYSQREKLAAQLKLALDALRRGVPPCMVCAHRSEFNPALSDCEGNCSACNLDCPCRECSDGSCWEWKP